MSLPWARQLRVGISPGGAAVLVSGALRARPIERMWCAAAGSAASHAPWRPAVEALRRGLTTRAFNVRSALLTVSDHFCRYALLPNRVELTKHSERMAYVCHRMSGALQNDATKWDISVQTQPHAVLACAIERSLIDALQEVFRASRVRIRSMQPHFAAQYNRVRANIDKPAGWILVHEPGRLVIGQFDGRRWTVFTSRRTMDDTAQGLVWVLERERRLHALGRSAPRDVWLASAARHYTTDEFRALGYAVRVVQSPRLDEIAAEAHAYGLAA